MLSTLLRTMEREDAIETLREYLHHRDFFVRWHVMRELIALNAVAALSDLAQMAKADPRQEIRSAAARMLSRIEARAMSSDR
jgi:HEAT repeat protein